MGNSIDKYLKDPSINKLKSQFSKLELYMLALLFRDLSARQHGVIDKETFLQFFPLTGLWGERLFERFDLKHTGYIDFYEFIQGIATCCNSSEDEKMNLLFSLYDMDQDGYIKKKEMITMLYNYPKNHIKFITDELAPDGGERLVQITEEKRKSLQALDDVENHFQHQSVQTPDLKLESTHSMPRENIDLGMPDELVVADEQIGGSFLPIERDIKQPFSYFERKEINKEELKEIQIIEQMISLDRNQKSRPSPKNYLKLDLPSASFRQNSEFQDKYMVDTPNQVDGKTPTPSKNNHNNNEDFTANELVLNRGRRSSTSTIITDQSFAISTTVNTRVKEYASFMFKTFDGANSRGKISLEEFKQWLNMHPVILKVFDESFHQELWSTKHVKESKEKRFSEILEEEEKDKDSPLEPDIRITNEKEKPPILTYKEKPVEMRGFLFKKGKKTKSWKKRYFELEEHFLIYYEKKEDKYPKGRIWATIDLFINQGIMFLEGCFIEETNDYGTIHKYGFSITHKSPSYNAHYLYSNDKNEFEEWMRHLKLFKSSTIMDLYEFKEKIGTGKFSTVYRAVTKDSQQNEYAIKVIEKKLLKLEEKEFLLSETSVMKILDHPSMIKLIDTIETKTCIYIITEIVKDGDLFDYIITREYLEEYAASYVMKKLLHSIHYLHSRAIIHRDIKPENILITLGNNDEIKELKIIDFGFAKLVNEDTKILDSCGTPNYVGKKKPFSFAINLAKHRKFFKVVVMIKKLIFGVWV